MAERFWAAVELRASEHGSMPHTDVLVIDTQADGIFLLRFGADGEFAGDTWHRSGQEAQEQAAYEYGPHLRWAPIPETEAHPVGFAIQAHGRRR